ncbi:MAG: GNAT family N-acetyltransferase, partial [Acidimicrobiales bacterium]
MSLALLLGPQLRAFAEAGYETIGCSAPGPYVDELESWGIRHVALEHATRSNDLRADLVTFGEMVSVFRSLQPDIVHTHNPKPGVLGRLAARICGVPVVVNTVHGLYAQRSDPWQRRLGVYAAERLASTCSGAELVQSREDLTTLGRLRVPRAKLVLLGNGIDLARFAPLGAEADARSTTRRELGAEESDVVIGVVGRLVWEKGYREIFELAAALDGVEPRVRVVVVGPGDPAKRDAVDAASIRAAESVGVLFLGERPDMERLYAAFDLYVLASYREGFPRSAMEAAAMGLPVVATDIRGCRQVVDDGLTGVLVPAQDSQSLTSAVLALVRSPGERSAMGRAGRAKSLREFDQQKVIDLTLGVYDRLLGIRSAPKGARAGIGYRIANSRDVRRLAELHRSQLPHSFLASLGSRFLVHLYVAIVRSKHSLAIVATAGDHRVVGFVAGTENTRRLYGRFLARHCFTAGITAIRAVVGSPGRVLETLRYGSTSGGSIDRLPDAELLSMAVDPAFRGGGIGRDLVVALTEEFARRGVTSSRVVVGAENASAVRLYERCGFKRVGDFELHRGERSEVLV